MRPLATISALLVLAACATPREQCEARATRDLRVVNQLIDESRAVLARGYAIETVDTVYPRMTLCRIGDGRSEICWVDDLRRTTRPVAVNLDEVRATLASLLKKKDELEVTTRAALAACQSLPDS
jgi:hypothetical protein